MLDLLTCPSIEQHGDSGDARTPALASLATPSTTEPRTTASDTADNGDASSTSTTRKSVASRSSPRSAIAARTGNYRPDETEPGFVSDNALKELTQFVERVERLEEEKKAISEDIRDVYAEMKGRGFDVRAVRQIVRIRKQDHSERKEMEAILKLYMSALNMN
jgi:uncharacterized protein (UPF0335 family)